LKIGFIVEGSVDQGVVPGIAGKILGKPVEPTFVFKKGGGFKALFARNKLETLLRALRTMSVEVAVVVVDNDCRPPRERIELIEKRIPEDGARPTVVGVAVEMIEAWLLACPEAFEAVFLKPIRLAKNPEDYRDPKREVILPYLGEYTPYRTLNKDLGERIVSSPSFDISRAIGNCRSLGEFSDKLKQAVSGKPEAANPIPPGIRKLDLDD
jgi:hypothetical protein